MASAVETEPLPPGCRRFKDGSTVLPRFAVLDECQFWDDQRNEWVTMSPERLNKIADRINARLARTGDALPIIPGHTTPGLPATKQPPIVGKAIQAKVEVFKNPRTGQPVIDEQTGAPKQAIYVTPIADPGALKYFKEFSRGRSVELWLDQEGGDDIDPIALLGAQTPRRDLGPHIFHRIPGSPLGLHQFSRHAGSTARHFQLEVEDGDPVMAEPNMPPDDGAPDADAAKQEAVFENSALGKRLAALADAMEAFLSSHEGQPGGDMPPGDGNPPMPAGGEGDLFTEPEPEPTRAAASCASPMGPMNTFIPNREGMEGNMMPKAKTSTPSTTANPMQRPAAPVQLARPAQPNAESIKFAAMERKVKELEAAQAASAKRELELMVNQELGELAEHIVFDHAKQFQRLSNPVLFSKPEARQQEYEYMLENFQKKADVPPGGGTFQIPPSAISISPVQLARGTPSMQPQQPSHRFSENDDAAIIAAAKAAHNGDGDADTEAILAAAVAKRGQMPNGRPVVAVR